MNKEVEASIKGRKDAFFNFYDITDADLKKKIEDYFKEVEEFGKGCSGSADFEAKFASSELNQKYVDLFTEVGTKCKPKNVELPETEEVSAKDLAKEELDYEMKEAVDSAGRAVRRKANEKMLSEARSTPILGDIMEAKQHYDLFSRFKKKNKDE